MAAAGTAVMTMTHPAGFRAASEAVPLWCRDLVSCLQSTFAMVLSTAGREPLNVLGTHWEFRFRPGDVRPEEFYYPCRVPGDLAASLAPEHPVSSRWRQPDAAADPLAALEAALAAGQLPIAAVDNFYLPFRPAFGDVHAAHLIVVHGVDRARGEVSVSDAMPPQFRGPIAAADFLLAWSSPNPADAQDVFFSAAKIDRRFLTLTIGEPFPELDRDLLHRALTANLAGFSGTGETADWVGTAGLDRFLAGLVEAAGRGESGPLADAYPFGWGMQAQASLHAELLRRFGSRAGLPELREAARLVEMAAHAWTALRMTAAHGREHPAAVTADLARHASALRRGYERALEAEAQAVSAL
jgi:hypothetical protein